MISLVVPAPVPFITSNQRPHWAVRARETAAWRHATRQYARAERLPMGLQRVRITAFVCQAKGRIRDASNAQPTIKAAIDGLVDYGLFPDDSDRHVDALVIQRGPRSAFPLGSLVLVIEEN